MEETYIVLATFLFCIGFIIGFSINRFRKRIINTCRGCCENSSTGDSLLLLPLCRGRDHDIEGEDPNSCRNTNVNQTELGKKCG